MGTLDILFGGMGGDRLIEFSELSFMFMCAVVYLHLCMLVYIYVWFYLHLLILGCLVLCLVMFVFR